MKVKTQLSRIWCSIVGSLFSLAGLAQTDAAVGPAEQRADANLEPKNRAARPDAPGVKTQTIEFETPGQGKSKGVIGIRPDGRIRGLLAQAGKDKYLEQGPQPPPKGKAEMPPIPITSPPTVQAAPPPQDKDKAYKPDIVPSPPSAQDKPKDKFFDVSTSPRQTEPPPATQKDPQQMQTPKEKAWTYWQPAPEKPKAIMPPQDKSKLPAVQRPGQDERIDEQLLDPGQDPGPTQQPPGPQSLRPGVDYSILLTDEQKSHAVMGTRDRVWVMNPEGRLERRLAGGARAVIKEDGWVEICDREGRLVSAYRDPRAEKIERATRIAERMKQRIQGKNG